MGSVSNAVTRIGIGDRCVSLNVGEDLFGEIAAAGGQASSLAAPSLPTPEALPVVAALQALSLPGSWLAEELALRLVERVIALMAGDRRAPGPPTGREAKRVVEAIRLIESEAARPLELKEMAASAAMSKYHFLRVFPPPDGRDPPSLSDRRPPAPRRARAWLVPPAGS